MKTRTRERYRQVVIILEAEPVGVVERNQGTKYNDLAVATVPYYKSAAAATGQFSFAPQHFISKRPQPTQLPKASYPDTVPLSCFSAVSCNCTCKCCSVQQEPAYRDFGLASSATAGPPHCHPRLPIRDSRDERLVHAGRAQCLMGQI